MPQNTTPGRRDPASFRDPDAFIFFSDEHPYRALTRKYLPDYDMLLQSGLYDVLVERGLLVSHDEVASDQISRFELPEDVVTVLKPRRIPLLSFPYEWSVPQLADAALATLEIMKLALARGMWLKDASAYNIQFFEGRPLLIDTSSFEKYPEGQPWPGYQQFCRHFLGPLALMSKVDARLARLLRDFTDGIPLELASSILPRTTWLRPGLLMHLHLHAAAQQRYSGAGARRPATGKVSKQGLEGILASLESAIASVQASERQTEWGDYYETHNYSEASFAEKQRLVRELAGADVRGVVLDLGANDGTFGRLFAGSAEHVVCLDIDHGAVLRNYGKVRRDKEKNVLPLVFDLMNPSPAIGWANRERRALFDRVRPNLVLALALIHHVCLSNNVPISDFIDLLWDLGGDVIVEWVPKDDPQALRLLAAREDVFDRYDETHFEQEATRKFAIARREPVAGTNRRLYLLRRSQE